MNNTSQFRQRIAMQFLQSACVIAFWPAFAAVILGFIGSTSAAHAALVHYTSETVWQSAVTSPVLINFDTLADGTAVSSAYPGVTFSPLNGSTPLAAAESFPYSLPNVLAVDNLLGGSGGGVAIEFSSSQKGVAFWYSDSQFVGNTVTVFDSLNQVLGRFELEPGHPTEWLFIGFTSLGNDISKVEVEMGNEDRVTLDNVQYSAPVIVPCGM